MEEEPGDRSGAGYRGATAEATASYRDRQVAAGVDAAHFRTLDGRVVSSLGIGTYLGAATAAADAAYSDAIGCAVELGTNAIDAAINYRCQRSERAIGAALAELVRGGRARRAELYLSTKGGFVPFDG